MVTNAHRFVHLRVNTPRILYHRTLRRKLSIYFTFAFDELEQVNFNYQVPNTPSHHKLTDQRLRYMNKLQRLDLFLFLAYKNQDCVFLCQ